MPSDETGRAGSPGEPLLTLDGLSIRFKGAQANVVDGVSLSVNPGETLCIVGESGCGKSVTALSLMGLLPVPPAEILSGRAMFEGRDLLGLTRRELGEIRGDRVSMIFQEPMTSLNPVYTVGDQIAEIVLRHRRIGKREARARALEMLRRVKVPAPEKRLDDYPHQLSGGMRQRVMIAMALANDPQLLIADEPTTALDVTIQAQILDLIRTLQDESGTALILITHDLGVVAEIADTVAVMYAGRVVEQGSVTSVFDDPQHPYTIGLMSSVPSLGKRTGSLATVPGMVPTVDTMPDGCRFAPRCPFASEACRREAPPLRRVDASQAPGHRVACVHAPLETTFGGVAA
ncbi:ABC transporter ATP-binding protein [Stappia stellulata]|uniref:ABC transporter ATP-binding protein n=1 Tax=Stappia stellulata TaxID=71235 RepID=UPI00041B3D86|nr:ABC transporter ATP-binding protein [Stappia stellulata]